MLTQVNNLGLRFSIATVCATANILVCINWANAICSPHKTSTSDSVSFPSKRECDLLFTEIISTDSSLAQQLANTYLKREPLAALSEDMTLEQAISLQKEFVQALISHLGPVVGYKAGLTSPIAQQSFNVSHPVRGVLLQQMLLDHGAVVSAQFGARPLWSSFDQRNPN